MLYDILPPLFLFASIGGIIVVVSRVTLRIKRDAISTQIHAETASASRAKAERAILNPGKKGVKLMGNRLAHGVGVLKSSATRTREGLRGRRQTRSERKEERQAAKAKAKQERRQAKAASKTAKRERVEEKAEEKIAPGKSIQRPASAWRDKLSNITSRTKERLPSIPNPKEKLSSTKTLEVEDTSPSEGKSHAIRAIAQKRVAKEAAKQTAPQSQPQPASQKQSQSQPPKPTKSAEPAQSAPRENTIKKEDLSASRRQRLLKKVRRKPEEPVAASLQQAKAAIKAGHYGQAEDILLQYIVQNTKDTQAYLLLSQVAMAQENWNEALEICEQVERMNINQSGLKAAKGKAALHSGKMTLALQTLQRAHDEDPENKEILRDLITIAQRMDNPALKDSAQAQLTQIEAGETEPA